MAKRVKWTLLLMFVLLIALALYSSSKPRLRLPTGTGPAKVALGDSHGVILASDGSLWVWGEEESGWPVLGLGTVRGQPTLRRLGQDTDWVDVAAGHSHTLALKADGTIWAWGENFRWQLGDGTSACAPFWNCCLLLMRQDGSLWALDDVLDQRGKRLGNPAWKMQPVPLRRIALQKDIVAFSGGRHHLGVAVTGEGEVWTWGWALGQRSPATAIVQALSQLLNRAGVRNNWGQGRTDHVVHPEPWQLPNLPPL
jgi:alpha-tubulin suppressor-like RCC1 family protein